MTVADRLLTGDAELAVWGCGHVGYSAMAAYALEGVPVVGYDIDTTVVNAINTGEIPVPDVGVQLQFDPTVLAERGLIRATNQVSDLAEAAVHLVCVPTERNAAPYEVPLLETMDTIADLGDDPVVIIESTLTPGTAAEARDRLPSGAVFGVAPRRDWFTAPDKTLRTIPRVYGAATPAGADIVAGVLGIVCNELVRARDHEHAELSKSVENAIYQVGIGFANQLTRAYPGVDVRHVLALAGTKWNIPTFHPSIGGGGYCIPIAALYVQRGAQHREELSLLEATVETNREQPRVVASAIAYKGADSVAVLGIAYKGNVTVDTLSPGAAVARELVGFGLDVGVHDPRFDAAHVEGEIGARSIGISDIAEYDAVVVAAGHDEYKQLPWADLEPLLADAMFVIDTEAVWRKYPIEDTGTRYYAAGEPDWIE